MLDHMLQRWVPGSSSIYLEIINASQLMLQHTSLVLITWIALLRMESPGYCMLSLIRKVWCGPISERQIASCLPICTDPEPMLAMHCVSINDLFNLPRYYFSSPHCKDKLKQLFQTLVIEHEALYSHRYQVRRKGQTGLSKTWSEFLQSLETV